MKRDELLAALREARAQMDAALAGLTEAQMLDPGVMEDWSVKDILAHLAAWEAEAVRLVSHVSRGRQTQPVAQSQAEVDALNARWYRENKNRPLENVLADFRGVRRQMLRQVEALSDAELSQKIPWLKDRRLLDLIPGDSFEHEAEHLEHIRAWRQGKLGGAG